MPDDAKADFAAYNAGTQRVVAAIRKMKADANRGRERQYGKDSARFEKQAAARERSAIRLGFKTCGRKNPVE